MPPSRILMVSNFQRKTNTETFYRTTFHLQHGLIRAGHMVLAFSDRDTAREASLFGSQKTGKGKMLEKLIGTAVHFRPDLILFGHADLIDAAGFRQIREAAPNAVLAQLNVDPTSRPHVMARFGERAHSMDLSFITSASLGPAADVLPTGHRTHFMPNPVDPACERHRVFDAPKQDLRRDGAFLGSKAVDRPAQLATIASGLPDGFRWEVHGDVIDQNRINGARFYDYLAETAMSPALQPDSTIDEQYLYASNRVAQQLGNGVLTFGHASSRLEEMFEDGMVFYSDADHLVQEMARLFRDDAERRRRAELGWRLAHEKVASQKVGAYVAAVALGETPAPCAWPSDPIDRAAPPREAP